MPYISHEGINIHYLDEGSGPAVVLCHAASGHSGQWRNLIERLHNQFRLLAIDHIGYGQSDPWPKERSFSVSHDVAAVQNICSKVSGPIHMIGHSLGGVLAAHAALGLGNRILSLTLVEPVMFTLLRDQGENEAWKEITSVKDEVCGLVAEEHHDKAANLFIDYWAGEGTWTAMPDKAKSAIQSTMERVAIGFMDNFETSISLEALGNLNVPSLLIRGSETTLAATRVVEILRSTLPECALVEIPGAGHMSPITHTDLVNEAIVNHLMQAAR